MAKATKWVYYTLLDQFEKDFGDMSINSIKRIEDYSGLLQNQIEICYDGGRVVYFNREGGWYHF